MGCIKDGTVEEIKQNEDTRLPDKFIPNINGIIYEEEINDSQSIEQIVSESRCCQFYPGNEEIIAKNYLFQGEIGENYVHCVATIALGLTPVEFDQKYHGIDSIFRDNEGNLVIVESKFSESGDGLDNLAISKKGIKQASEPWLNIQLDRMQGEGKYSTSKLHTKTNSDVAKNIRDAIDQGKLRRLLIHTNTKCLNVAVSECNDQEQWTTTKAFRFAKFE